MSTRKCNKCIVFIKDIRGVKVSIGFEDNSKINNSNNSNNMGFIYDNKSTYSKIPNNINNIFKQIQEDIFDKIRLSRKVSLNNKTAGLTSARERDSDNLNNYNNNWIVGLYGLSRNNTARKKPKPKNKDFKQRTKNKSVPLRTKSQGNSPTETTKRINFRNLLKQRQYLGNSYKNVSTNRSFIKSAKSAPVKLEHIKTNRYSM